MRPVFSSPVARAIPFDNTSNGFPEDATNVQAAIESALAFSPQHHLGILFDDFLNSMTWSPSTTGSGAVASVSGGNSTFASGKHIGVAQIELGSVVSTSAALVQSGNLSISTVFGSGAAEYQTLVRIPTLATANDDYILRFGFGTSTTADHANGIYFEYNRSNSVNWSLKTASSSSRTTHTSSIAVTNNTWIHCRFVVNSAGTNVDYYIDGVLGGSITTNIPTTTGEGAGPNFQIVSTAFVSVTRAAYFDYFYFTKHFTARD